MNVYHDYIYISLLLLCELIIGIIIIKKVPYTEIDWVAYMEEVSGWYDAQQYDYILIKGNTGPLVYPAGFLYLFWLFRYIILALQGSSLSTTPEARVLQATSPEAVRIGQYIFLVLYLVTQLIVLLIYQHYLQNALRSRCKQRDSKNETHSTTTIPTYHHDIWSFRLGAMALVCLSKRVHSIFLLRLFNDGPCMMLLYTSLLCMISGGNNSRWNWRIGCFLFSLAVSIKMNVLLFAPGLLLLLLQSHSNLWDTICMISLYCGIPQLILGFPFLISFPISYIRKAFEFDRVFFHQWTVNWKMLPEELFISKSWALVLLSLHLSALVYAFCYRWRIRALSRCGGRYLFLFRPTDVVVTGTGADYSRPRSTKLSGHYIVLTLLVSNFIGIVFARTLHYQFYVWYYHAIPYFLWTIMGGLKEKRCATTVSSEGAQDRQDVAGESAQEELGWSYPIWMRLLIWLALESSFLTFPATPISSAILQVCHILILVLVIAQPPDPLLRCDEVDASGLAGSNRSKAE
jgi:alpha-1,3-mannosyltransferase